MPDINTQRSAALWSWFVALCSSQALGTPQGVTHQGAIQGAPQGAPQGTGHRSTNHHSGLQVVSGDASFRRYFRAYTERGSWVLVDAPPQREDSATFIAVQQRLQGSGTRVPAVVAVDLEQGFMCLEDFGSELLLTRLQAQPETAGLWYHRAFAQLLRIQASASSGKQTQPILPAYDEALLRREMQLFSDWLCGELLNLQLSTAEQALWEVVQTELVEAALAQPSVVVHRDYHARNLMVLEADGQEPALGVIDFQDAVSGPCSYDLVSLLEDCYIAWPREQVRQWLLEWWAMAETGMEQEAFLRAADLMGIQRHLKAAGIFCRLWLRDGKPGYLQDLPRTLAYITRLDSSGALREFADFLQARVLPGVQLKLLQLQQEGVLPGEGSGA